MFCFFEREISNVIIKSFVWHICHEDIKYSVLHQGRCSPAVTWAESDAIWIAK